MKRVLFMAMAAVLLFAPAANAQKVNDAAIRQKLEKSDAEIKDAKKNTKAATWINRAKVYFESIQAPTKDLFPGMPFDMVKMTLGSDGTSVSDNEIDYPWLKLYIRDNKVFAWEQTKFVNANAGTIAQEALLKAYELDEKQAVKIKPMLDDMVKFYTNVANVTYEIPRYDLAAEAYETVFNIQTNPAYGAPVYENLYFAGQLSAFLGANNPALFAKGEKLLKQAIDGGYADVDGNIYYYLFHCYYGQKADDAANVLKGKEALLEGISKFPKNDRILDGLMQLYTSEEGVGDPADLVDLIDKALADEPNNADLWFGRGRVYYKLNNFDECINSFKKVVEIKPDLFEGNYYLALFYQIKGEQVGNEINARDWKSQSEYETEWRRVIDIYKEAVPWYEKAHQINPEHLDTVECLKIMYTRLRDEGPDYMEKFTKYSDLFRQMSAK